MFAKPRASDTETLDGVTLATGCRILLKDQSTGADNGIYVVNPTGAPTRGLDFNANDEAGGAVLSVRDTGYGIPLAHLPRITERFYRVSTSRSRESGGTGLGLSIVKHVLNLHQARLEIESEVGHGSTFSIHFTPERVSPRDTALPRIPTQSLSA